VPAGLFFRRARTRVTSTLNPLLTQALLELPVIPGRPDGQHAVGLQRGASGRETNGPRKGRRWRLRESRCPLSTSRSTVSNRLWLDRNSAATSPVTTRTRRSFRGWRRAAQGTAIPFHHGREQFHDHHGGGRRQDVKRGAEGEAHPSPPTSDARFRQRARATAGIVASASSEPCMRLDISGLPPAR